MRRPNERLLEAFGGGWECPPVLPGRLEHDPPGRARSCPRPAPALAEYGSAPVFVWKDPRTCMTLPFWLELLDEPPVDRVHPPPPGRGRVLAAHPELARHRARVRARGSASTVTRSVIRRPAHGRVRVRRAAGRSGGQHARGWSTRSTAGASTSPTTRRPPTWSSPPKRRHHEADAGVFDDPVSTAVATRAVTRSCRSFAGVHDAFALDEPLPEPSPISTELLEICAQLRASRQETRQANTELRRLAGSRKRLLRRLIQSQPPGLDRAARRARRRTRHRCEPRAQDRHHRNGPGGHDAARPGAHRPRARHRVRARRARSTSTCTRGLETGIEAPDAPRIVKNPNLSRRLGELLDAGKVEIEHVIIPIRDLDVAAAEPGAQHRVRQRPAHVRRAVRNRAAPPSSARRSRSSSTS